MPSIEDVDAKWVRRVLVVEDQSALRALMCDTLQRHDWEVKAVADAEEALREFAELIPMR